MAQYSAAIFFRLATDPVVRLWAGVGDFELPADLVETTGGTYKGMGELLNVPAVQQLINGLAERLTFQLSGVDATALRLAEEDADEVRGAQVNLGFLRLDSDLQPIFPVRWIWEGEADSVPCAKTDGVRTIAISVGTNHTDRKRPGFETYTPANQHLRSPTDAGCDFVPLYTQGSTKKWA